MKNSSVISSFKKSHFYWGSSCRQSIGFRPFLHTNFDVKWGICLVFWHNNFDHRYFQIHVPKTEERSGKLYFCRATWIHFRSVIGQTEKHQNGHVIIHPIVKNVLYLQWKSLMYTFNIHIHIHREETDYKYSFLSSLKESLKSSFPKKRKGEKDVQSATRNHFKKRGQVSSYHYI